MYRGANDSNLPDTVKAMPVAARRQWVEAFNNSYARTTGDAVIKERRAFSTANGIMKGVIESLGKALDAATWTLVPGEKIVSESYGDYDVAPESHTTPLLAAPPTRVQAMLPDEEARSAWLEAYNLCALLGCPIWHCEEAAWKAVDAAGYASEDLPKYVKVAESASLTGRIFRAVESLGDSTPGSVFDVVLITVGVSKNKRRYTEAVIKRAAPLFEGAKAYGDHPTKADLANRSGNRSVNEIVGWYTDVRFDEGSHSLIGRLHVLESADWLKKLLTEMTNGSAPADLIGLSINAAGEQKLIKEGGEFIQDVTDISRVYSVDVVTEPAAGGSVVRLVASIQHEEDENMDPRLKALLEGLSATAAEGLKTFVEGMDEADREKYLNTHAPKADPVTPVTEQVAQTQTPTANVAVLDRPTVDVAITEATSALREEMQGLRIEAMRGYINTKMATTRLPVPMRESLQKRFDTMLERRETDRNEVDALFSEAQDMWAALENNIGSGKVDVPGVSRDGTGRFAMGDSGRDDMIKAIDGMFYNKDIDGVKRFAGLREAYCTWTGQSPFSTGPEKIMRESHTNYDSAIEGSRIMESMTTASWANVFADRLHRRMLAEYNLENLQEWRSLVSNIESVTDFRAQRRDRIGGYGLLSTVGEGVTYPQLTSPSDEEASYTIQKRGGLDDITFEMVANDDMRNIRNIPVKLARAAKQTLFRFVMDMIRTGHSTGTIYDGAALFHSSHSNTLTTALGDAGLSSGWQLMRDQTAFGNTTEKLGTRPKHLWVPNELEQLAWRLANSAVSILSANFNATEPNFFNNKLEVHVIDYWTDANNWFLSADPTQIPTIEMGFFNGQEEPELFVQDQPNVGSVMTADKITYKVRHIYSGTVLDWRGFVGSDVT